MNLPLFCHKLEITTYGNTKNALPNDIFKNFFLFFCENVIFHYLKKMFSIHLSWFTENLSLLHYLYLFCCFLVKSQVTESFLPFSLILFCKIPDIFQYDRKFTTSRSLSFLLLSCKVTNSRNNFLSGSQISFFKTAIIFRYNRKYITS